MNDICTKISDFFTPSLCPHLELISTIKFTQPPLLCLTFHGFGGTCHNELGITGKIGIDFQFLMLYLIHLCLILLCQSPL